jgi:hypothetical protein
VHTRARFQPNGTLPFVFKLDPTLEHIDELKLSVMQMRLTGKFVPACGADHTGSDPSLGGLLQPQISVLKKRAQTPLELSVLSVGDYETLRCQLHLLKGQQRQ